MKSKYCSYDTEYERDYDSSYQPSSYFDDDYSNLNGLDYTEFLQPLNPNTIISDPALPMLHLEKITPTDLHCSHITQFRPWSMPSNTESILSSLFPEASALIGHSNDSHSNTSSLSTSSSSSSLITPFYYSSQLYRSSNSPSPSQRRSPTPELCPVMDFTSYYCPPPNNSLTPEIKLLRSLKIISNLESANMLDSQDAFKLKEMAKKADGKVWNLIEIFVGVCNEEWEKTGNRGSQDLTLAQRLSELVNI